MACNYIMLNLIKQENHNLPTVIILKITKNALEIQLHLEAYVFPSVRNGSSLAVINILENIKA